MTRRLAAGLALLLALAAQPALAKKKPAVPAAPAAPSLSAAALLDSVVAHLGRLDHFCFEGRVHAEAEGTGLPQKNVLDMPFLYAAERPTKLRNDLRNPYGAALMVADGDSLWTSVPSLSQYMVRPAPRLEAGAA